jgi:hypothetical protein
MKPKKHITVRNVENAINTSVGLVLTTELLSSKNQKEIDGEKQMRRKTNDVEFLESFKKLYCLRSKNQKEIDGEKQMRRKTNGYEELENELMVIERDDVEFLESFKEFLDGECPETLTLMEVEMDDWEIHLHLTRDKSKDIIYKI